MFVPAYSHISHIVVGNVPLLNVKIVLVWKKPFSWNNTAKNGSNSSNSTITDKRVFVIPCYTLCYTFPKLFPKVLDMFSQRSEKIRKDSAGNVIPCVTLPKAIPESLEGEKSLFFYKKNTNLASTVFGENSFWEKNREKKRVEYSFFGKKDKRYFVKPCKTLPRSCSRKFYIYSAIVPKR